MSADPKRINQDESISDLYARVRALERRHPLANPYAYLEASGTLPAGPTTGKYWWDLVPAGPDFTNDPDVFANTTLAIAAGPTNVNSGTFHGISILQPGLYKAYKNILIAALYNDATLRAITYYQGTAGPTFTSDMQFGDPAHISQGHGQHFDLWSVFEGDTPTSTVLFESENGESSSYGCVVTLLIEMIDDTPINF